MASSPPRTDPNEPKPPPDKSWMKPHGPPEARIERTGRWKYYVTVHHGITTWGPGGRGWAVLGRRRAERKARRLLTQYVRQLQREDDIQVLTLGPCRPTEVPDGDL